MTEDLQRSSAGSIAAATARHRRIDAREAGTILRDAEVPVQTKVPGAVNHHKFSIG